MDTVFRRRSNHSRSSGGYSDRTSGSEESSTAMPLKDRSSMFLEKVKENVTYVLPKYIFPLRYTLSLLLLAFAGLLLAFHAVQIEEAAAASLGAARTWCDFGPSASCSRVLSSKYSHMLALSVRSTFYSTVTDSNGRFWFDFVSNAHLGVVYYLFVAGYAIFALYYRFSARLQSPSAHRLQSTDVELRSVGTTVKHAVAARSNFVRIGTSCLAFSVTHPPSLFQISWLIFYLSFSTLALISSLVLAYLLAFVLRDLCVICVATYLINAAIFGIFCRMLYLGLRDYLHCYYYIPVVY